MTRTKITLGVAVVLAVAAALLWRFGPPELFGDRKRASPADTAFALVDALDRELDGAAALALTFSLPLDARKRYDDYVKVFEMPVRPGEAQTQNRDSDRDGDDDEENRAGQRSVVSTDAADVDPQGGKPVPGAWVVGENPRLLFFPGVKPETRYVVRILPGVPAKDGKALAAESRYSIRTASVGASYYFASRGVVLPAKQNGGLPVVTVNVPEVDVQFLRVKPDRLPAFLDRVIATPRKKSDLGADDDNDNEEPYYGNRSLQGAVGGHELDALRSMTEPAFSGRFTTEQRPNRRSVTFLPVETIEALREPGVYVAVMSQPGRFRYDFQTTYFYVSDLGLTLRLFAKTADAFVSSLTDGAAVGRVDVAWLDAQGKILARAETDGDGHAAFAARPKGAKMVAARKGQQVSIVALKEPALDLSEYPVVGERYAPTRLFAYSGRNLYRPGETFAVSVLARDADGRPGPPQPVQAILKRPDGKHQFEAMWSPEKDFAGYYRRAVALPADAPTGFWTLELRADPADKVPTTSLRFGVEEFLPERLKLDLQAKPILVGKEKSLAIAVQGSYLYGAPAAGNRLLGVLQYERNRNPLAAKLPGFEFGDANEDTVKGRQELAEAMLDDAGHAQMTIDLDPTSGRRSPYSLRTTVSLLETGGRPVVRTLERVHWPAPVLVGVRPLFAGDYAREGAVAQFEVVRADTEGNLEAGAALPVKLFRENRAFHWRFDDQRGWHSSFTETDELVETGAVTIPAAGRGRVSVPVKYGRYRLEVFDPDTGLTTRYRFYAGWSARGDEMQGVRPDRVALQLDKPAYRDGDTARLTITPPHAGKALVTIEGDRTLWVKRLAMGEGGTTLALPLDKAWQRHDLYVSVVVFRPGNEGDKVTPARALGIVHLPLERGDRKLAVTLDVPQKIEPETTLKVKLKVPDAKGEKVMATVSAVDAGILNITRFATPDPHGFFFGRLRYGADHLDVYGKLIEKMAGHKGTLRFGGDNTPQATRSLPKKVKLVDLFSGPVTLDELGEAEIGLAVPDFNGALRVMAVVSGAQRFGAQEAEVAVAAPIVAEIAMPRFITFGDVATIGLDLHNLSGADQRLQVALVGGDALKIGDAVRNVVLKDQQRTTLRFSVEPGNAIGLAPVRMKVEGGSIRIARAFALQVQTANPPQQLARGYQLAPGETLELRDSELGGLLRQTVTAHLAVSDRPPIDVRSAIQGLLTYPYGCAEQTTSTAYPYVFVDEAAAREYGLEPYSREQRADMLEKAIGRIVAMQAPNGGFSLWGNVSEYEYWLSAYVTSFLQDARTEGFVVPEAAQKKALDFLLRGLQEGVGTLPRERPAPSGFFADDRHYGGAGRFGVLAFGGYVLARESRAPLATLKQLYESRGLAHSGLALVQLGLALKLMGDEERATTAVREGLQKGREPGWWSDYGTPLRDAALSYALLARHGVTAEARENLPAIMNAEMAKTRYYSTQEKLALFLVGRSFAAQAADGWTAEVVSGGKSVSISGNTAGFREVAAGELASGFKVVNTQKGPLYLELALNGVPVKSPAPKSDVVALSRTFFEASGAPLAQRPLKVGETLVVRVKAKPRFPIANAMVIDRLPAGLEIENLNLAQGESLGVVRFDNVDPAEAMRDRQIQHVEFRDDRFVAALRLEREATLFYRVRVVTPGRFVVPPTYAEDMYRPDNFGITAPGDTMTVTDAAAP